ncbi:hypothetical protein Tco_0749047 [Tanacetum coccineum]|uniref:Uncharacterized protein n=1 Tax=Tanacetum coccineum TaxID=301880 RepID=A0ABQ4YYB1_9ASTR
MQSVHMIDKEAPPIETKADGVRSRRQSYAQGLTLERSHTVRYAGTARRGGLEFTWEREDSNKEQNTHSFPKLGFVIPLQGLSIEDKALLTG